MQKVIMISRDVKVLDPKSDVYIRISEYAKLFDEFHIVVIRGNIFSFIKSFFEAGKFARKVGKGGWITSQDPFEAGVVAFVIAKFLGLRLQLQLHTDIFAHFYARHSVSNFLRMQLAIFIIPKADSLRVVSQNVKKHISEKRLLLENKIHLLPIHVDVQSISAIQATYNLRERYPEFEKIVLIVSRLEREKNLPLAFEAFRKILRKVPNAGLVIQGDGSQRKRLQRLAEHLKITQRVRFEGWSEDTVSAYRSADLLLVTSFYEGYGMSIVESLACGCPVVSTDVGIANEAGAEVANYDAGEIALKSISILEKGKRGELKKDFISDSKQEYLNKYKQTFS